MRYHYKKLFYIIFLIGIVRLDAYAYLPDEMSVSDILLINAHNASCSTAYGWRYAQQRGTLRQQWKAGARGMKINIHWRKPMNFTQHINTLMHDSLSSKLSAQDSLKNEKQGWFSQFKQKTGNAVKNISGNFITQNDKQPFIAVCHEPDGANNCMLSAHLQKSGEVQSALESFTEYAALLKENQDDIALIIIEDYLDSRSQKNGTTHYDAQKIQTSLDDIIKQSGLSSYAYKFAPDYFNIPTKKWPTVGELRNTNKRLFLFTHSHAHAAASPYLNYYGSEFFRRSHWEYNWETDIGKSCKLLYPSQATMFMISHGAEVSFPTGTIPSGVLFLLEKFGFNTKAPGGGGIKGTDYKILNNESNIRQRITDCQTASAGTPVSVIGLDFVEDGNVNETVKKINKERAESLGFSLKE